MTTKGGSGRDSQRKRQNGRDSQRKRQKRSFYRRISGLRRCEQIVQKIGRMDKYHYVTPADPC